MYVHVGGRGIVWFGVKYFEMLTFCHRIISDPNQSPSDISSDVLLKIILSPGLHNLGQYRVNEEEGVKLRRQPFF